MGAARVIRPDRAQTRWDYIDLEGLLVSDHRARVVWSFVESLDLSELYDAIQSRQGESGRPAADPAVLLALWLYATVEGVGSARELDRLVERDVAYRWIAGGVPVNYHGLADFRVEHLDVLDRLLTESVTALIKEGLVSLDEIAVDGTKVRASASKASFKTETKLMRIEAAVAARLAELKAEISSDPEASSRRRRAARERAARDIQERAARARKALEQIKAEKAERAKRHAKDEAKKSEPKASLSDAEARNMKFADGAIRPGYNAQIAAAPQQGIIMSIEMTDRRNDSGLAAPMIDDLVRRYGKVPEKLLVDTHYATVEDIAALSDHPAGRMTIYAPPPTERTDISPAALKKRLSKRRGEPESVKDWRSRMASDTGQAIYRLRKLIERVNADRKNHGLGHLPVRGLIKAKAVALMHALAHNLIAAQRLRTKCA
jgi:transposase